MHTEDIITLKKKYLQEIRSLLPTLRIKEKAYLQGISQNIDDYLEENSASLQKTEDFYAIFGEPHEVLQTYYSGMEKPALRSCIRMHQIKQISVLAFCSLFLILALFLAVIVYQEHQMVMREEMVSVTTTITIEENL